MSPFVLSVLKYALLALLYFFIYRAVKSVAIDLSGRRSAAGRSAESPAAPQPAKARPSRTGKAPTSMTVHAPDAKRPRTFKLSGSLDVGRAEACQVRLEDTYVSQHHARLSARDGAVFVEDLGSTNGTYLNDRRVQAAVEVRPGDVVRVGKTVLELKR
jgi:pSer/pThr/pTyr-binding forkhead associated (FHA) protein